MEMGMIRAVVAGVLIFGGTCAGLAQEMADSDHDGLSDAMEQSLLERFVPRFKVSKGDCGVAPSSFVAGLAKPTPIAADATIYGQAMVHEKSSVLGPQVVELHYYDLWSVDCGRMGHALDAEHVSVLVTAESAMQPANAWRALYWYAAAHEDTVCDASTVGDARALQAEEHGAVVWVSAGKHAAYLDEQTCRWGCGGDRCRSMVELKVSRVVNLGEKGAPMNGAVWVESNAWPLKEKLGSDFSEEWLSKLVDRKLDRPMQMNAAYSGVKGGIYGANAAVDGVGIGGTHTGAALSTADGKTENALGKSAGAVGRSLSKSKDAVVRFLGGKKK